MEAFFEVSGLNIYLQIAVTLISIISGVFGHIIYADEVAASIGWPLNSGFQTELASAAIGIGLIGFIGYIGFWNKSFCCPFCW